MMKQTCSFLCRRENSDIPLVVIGCVQEIEKRGKSNGLFGILNDISEIVPPAEAGVLGKANVVWRKVR